jgi:hypothetical protein
MKKRAVFWLFYCIWLFDFFSNYINNYYYNYYFICYKSIMTPKQIQMQEAIMLACHPWLNIQEIKEILHPNYILYASCPLDQVLTALGDKYFYLSKGIHKEVCWCDCADYCDKQSIHFNSICGRYLQKNLFDQDQETQDILFDIICWWTKKS